MSGVPRYSPSPPLSTLDRKGVSLSIETNTNQDRGLGISGMSLEEPVNLSRKGLSLFSPNLANFDSITQLPTPIINTGSFGTASPVETEASPIEMVKPRKKSSKDSQQGLNRALSEYRPTDRKQLLEAQDNKRIISNPIVEKYPQIPSPSDHLTHLEHQLKDTTFYSPKFGVSYKFVKIIGQGNFSHVILVESVDDKRHKVAIKIIHIPVKNRNQLHNFTYFLKRELNILYQMNHPNIIKLLDYSINIPIERSEIENEHEVESESEYDHEQLDQDLRHYKENGTHLNNDQLIFLNYCLGGNLYDFMNQNHPTFKHDVNFWIIARNMVKELILSVKYLHDHNIIHRDIKLENVLINYLIGQLMENPYQHRITCLTDFGLAKRLTDPNQLLATRCGSQDYIPPEILMGLKYNGKLTDTWSIGVLIYCLIENRLPFDLPPLNYLTQSGISPSVIKRKLNKNTPAHRIAMIDWDWYSVNDVLANAMVDKLAKQIIRSLQLIVDKVLVRKEKRVTIDQLIQMPEFDWLV